MTKSHKVSRKTKRNRRNKSRRPASRHLRFESLEDRVLLAADLLFADSFEQGEWNGAWVEDSQNDWFRSTQRESDGSYSAEVDGWASNATLTIANPLDLTSYDSAELTYSWYIESGFDSGEYIALDLFDGSSWNEVAKLRGNVDQENAWHNETVTIDGSYLTSDFQARFRAKVSSSREDGFVDNVRIEGTSAGLPEFSVSDATATEGDVVSSQFADAFISAGSGGLDGPGDLVFGADGNLYVGSKYGDAVLRYNGATGEFIDTFVSPGSGGLDNPQGLLFGPDGHLYVTSRITDEVLRFDSSTGAFIDAFVTAGSGGLDNPTEFTFGPDSHLHVTSGNTNQVLRYDGTTGAFIDEFVLAGAGGIDFPHGLEFGPDANLYVISQPTDSVLRYDGTTGAFMDTFVSSGSGGLDGPVHLAFGPGGDLFVASSLNHSVLRYDGTSGAFLEAYVSSGNGGLESPIGLLFDSNGVLYVSSRDTHEVLRYGAASQAVFTVTLSSPSVDPVTVDFNTSNATATAGSDYVAASGTLAFDPGVTSRAIIVSSLDDLDVEGDETFTLTLNTPTGATIADGIGLGTIVDNEVANVPPTANAGADQTVSDGDGTGTEVVTLNGGGSDGDGSIVSYAWTEGATVLGNTASISPTLGIGAHTLTLTVTDDGGASDSDTLVVTVDPNQGPAANAGADQTVSDGDGTGSEVVTLNGSGSDGDGSIVSYAWTEGATVLGNTASISPTLGIGAHTLTLTITDDGGASASDTVVVTVNPNQGPAANAGADQTVTDGDAVTLNGSGSDSDGTIVGYEWTEGATVLGATASISPTLGLGTHTLTLTVTDNGGATASDSVLVTVNPVVVSSTKFYVVDTSVDDMFEYQADGTLVTNYNLGSGNNAPRGVAATAAGDTVWGIDNDDHVYVHDNEGNLLRSWKANGLSRPEGIATDGTDIWIVDRGNDRVHYFAGGATRITDAGATSSFSLAAGNPRGVTTDGTHLWVVDTGSDKVYKYNTTGGPSLGSWSLNSGNAVPRGIAIDPSGMSNSAWVVDSRTDTVYEYDRDTGAFLGSFALAAGNTNPQGIADPPAPSAPLTPAQVGPVADDALLLLAPAPNMDPNNAVWMASGVNENSSTRLVASPRSMDGWMSRFGRDSESAPATTSVAATTTAAQRRMTWSDDVDLELLSGDFDGWLDLLARDMVAIRRGK